MTWPNPNDQIMITRGELEDLVASSSQDDRNEIADIIRLRS